MLVQPLPELQGPHEEALAFCCEKLGAEVTMPFGKTFWSPGFGMLADRLGVHWMVNTLGEEP